MFGSKSAEGWLTLRCPVYRRFVDFIFDHFKKIYAFFHRQTPGLRTMILFIKKKIVRSSLLNWLSTAEDSAESTFQCGQVMSDFFIQLQISIPQRDRKIPCRFVESCSICGRVPSIWLLVRQEYCWKRQNPWKVLVKWDVPRCRIWKSSDLLHQNVQRTVLSP